MFALRTSRAARLTLAASLAVLLGAGVPAIALEVKVTQDTGRLMPYQVFELTFQHRWDHRRGLVKDMTITIGAGKGLTGYWYDPRTANIISRFEVAKDGRQDFKVPPFEIDLALLVTSGVVEARRADSQWPGGVSPRIAHSGKLLTTVGLTASIPCS
ncbi:MAG: hypothetical protein GWP05_08880 [Anaerolineaceae bacterium]|nr:hypothetical protein [Anaerolineaceae bacterium]